MTKDKMSLIDLPQIIELYEVLEKNGLAEQKKEVQSLVSYIDNMESSLSEMMDEVQQLHSEIKSLHNKGIRNKCSQLAQKVEEKIGQVKETVSSTKNKIVEGAENAVKVYKEKGKTAFLQAISAMQMPAALFGFKQCFSNAANTMRQNAEKIDSVRAELHEVGDHIKNVGRVIFGKPTKQTKALEEDKGILAKFRDFVMSCGRSFDRMEQSADRLLTKINIDKPAGEKKASVKQKLNQLKNKQTEKVKESIQTELTR